MQHRRTRWALAVVAVVAVATLGACDVRDVDTSQGDYALLDRTQVTPSWSVGAIPSASSATQLTYSSYGSPATDLKMSVYLPSGVSGLRPTIVYVHGGGFFTGSRDELVTGPFYIGESMIAQLRRGWIVISVDYRLAYQGQGQDAADDVRAAVRYAKGLSDVAGGIGVDPTKVVLAGSSAGGNLAMLAAFDPSVPGSGPDSTVRGVVSLDGPSDLATLHDPSLLSQSFLTTEHLAALNTATMTSAEKSRFEELYGYDVDAPAPTPPESVVEAGEIVPAYTGCADPLDDCAAFTDLSPISHIDAGDPDVYLACADTGPSPYPSFCSDSYALEAAINGLHADDPYVTDPIERTLHAWVDELEGANHYNVDEYVNLHLLEGFLDRVVS